MDDDKKFMFLGMFNLFVKNLDLAVQFNRDNFVEAHFSDGNHSGKIDHFSRFIRKLIDIFIMLDVPGVKTAGKCFIGYILVVIL